MFDCSCDSLSHRQVIEIIYSLSMIVSNYDINEYIKVLLCLLLLMWNTDGTEFSVTQYQMYKWRPECFPSSLHMHGTSRWRVPPWLHTPSLIQVAWFHSLNVMSDGILWSHAAPIRATWTEAAASINTAWRVAGVGCIRLRCWLCFYKHKYTTMRECLLLCVLHQRRLNPPLSSCWTAASGLRPPWLQFEY